MLYSEKVKGFTAAHPCEELTAGGARNRLHHVQQPR